MMTRHEDTKSVSTASSAVDDGPFHCGRRLSVAGLNVRSGDTVHIHRIVAEGYCVEPLEHGTQVLLHLLVEGGLNDELTPVDHRPDLSLLDGDFSALDDVARILEDEVTIGPLLV